MASIEGAQPQYLLGTRRGSPVVRADALKTSHASPLVFGMASIEGAQPQYLLGARRGSPVVRADTLKTSHTSPDVLEWRVVRVHALNTSAAVWASWRLWTIYQRL